MSTDLKNVKGGFELQKFLDELPVKLEKNIMRGALRAGASVIMNEAISQLFTDGHIKTGKLVQGIKITTKLKNGKVYAMVKITGPHAHIGYWIEYTGAVSHLIKFKNKKALKINGEFAKLIKHPGFRSKPFLRPAFDSKTGDAIKAVTDQVKKKLTKQGIDTSDIEN